MVFVLLVHGCTLGDCPPGDPPIFVNDGGVDAGPMDQGTDSGETPDLDADADDRPVPCRPCGPGCACEIIDSGHGSDAASGECFHSLRPPEGPALEATNVVACAAPAVCGARVCMTAPSGSETCIAYCEVPGS